MHPANQTGESAAADPPEAWDPTRRVDAQFRNKAWDEVLGSSRKRDVFLATRELAAERACLEKTEIATKALAYPHFGDREKLRGGDLGDNGDLAPLRELGAVVPVPKIARPDVAYVVPFRELCTYLVDPYHAPTAEPVRHAIEYYCRTRDSADDGEGREEDADLPVDPFPVELYTYVRLASRLSLSPDRVRITAFRPTATDHDHARGFTVAGQLHGVTAGDESSVGDAEVKSALGELFVAFADHAARGKDVFRIGMYVRKDDEEDTRRDARRRAIDDAASFDTFDRSGGTVTFDWAIEPVIML